MGVINGKQGFACCNFGFIYTRLSKQSFNFQTGQAKWVTSVTSFSVGFFGALRGFRLLVVMARGM